MAEPGRSSSTLSMAPMRGGMIRRGAWRGLDGPALQHQRNHHDDEGRVEEELAVVHVADDRHDPEQDGDGAAQADPGDEARFTLGEIEGQQAEPDGEGTRNEDEEEGQQDGRQQDLRKLGRGCEEAEHEEHDDLGEPGHSVLETLDRYRRGQLARPGIDAGDINGEEAAAADQAGEGEDHQGHGQHEDRCQALLDLQPAQDECDRRPADETEDEADPHLLDEEPQQIERESVRAAAVRDQFDQRDGEEDRHGVVGAGFDFERRANPVADVDAADAQQEEHRRRVRGCEDRAQQHAFEIAEAEEEMGGKAKKRW